MVFVVGSVHMENFVGCLFCNFGTLPICASAFQKWRKRYCIQERFPTPDGPHLYIYILRLAILKKQRTPTNWMLTPPWMGYDSLDHHSSKMQRQEVLWDDFAEVFKLDKWWRSVQDMTWSDQSVHCLALNRWMPWGFWYQRSGILCLFYSIMHCYCIVKRIFITLLDGWSSIFET